MKPDSIKITATAQRTYPEDYLSELIEEARKKWAGTLPEKVKDIPSWLPKKRNTLEKWKKAYSVILSTKDRFQESYDNGDTDNPEPKIDDYGDALKEKGIKYSDRQLRTIIKAGEHGHLDF